MHSNFQMDLSLPWISGDPVVNVLDQQLVLEDSAIYKNHPLRPQAKCSQSMGLSS
jgi:hypothetical protein